ncbi:MAG: haloacid dehalogenase, partial [Hydrogenophaga sp.]|nr:haloacid dehalogenase [Hydrogenophaga sp.]
MEKPRAVLFDAYGTLFDVYSVALLAEQLFPGQGQRLSTLWRDKQIEYTRLVTTSNGGAHYQPFWALTQRALAYAIKVVAPAARQDWAAFEARAAQLLNQYRSLSAFPENREVLQALRARGIATGILSNGDPAMLGIAVRSAGLD